MINRRSLLLEMDDRLRKLRRTALAFDDPRSRMEHAHNLLRAGRPTEEVDHAIGDDNPHRHELVQSARGVGAHDLADHLELAPLARRYQRSLSTGTDEGRRDAHSALMGATFSSLQARGEPSRNDTDYHRASRYFSRDLAPDPRGTMPGTGLTDQIARFRGHEVLGGGSYAIDGHHSGSASNWDSSDVQHFKDDLDHHGLGKITHHEVANVRINSDPGDYVTARPWEHDYYAVSAQHRLRVDPRATTAHVTTPYAGGAAHEHTPRAYVSRDQRHAAWSAEQQRRLASGKT